MTRRSLDHLHREVLVTADDIDRYAADVRSNTRAGAYDVILAGRSFSDAEALRGVSRVALRKAVFTVYDCCLFKQKENKDAGIFGPYLERAEDYRAFPKMDNSAYRQAVRATTTSTFSTSPVARAGSMVLMHHLPQRYAAMFFKVDIRHVKKLVEKIETYLTTKEFE